MSSADPRIAPRWMTYVLRIAGVYNLAFGVWAIVFPFHAFTLAGFDPLPIYPALWQCIGMIVGVYGVGYLIAAENPYRHWPIVLVGMLGKIFGPIGFVYSVVTGQFPWTLAPVLLTNDLVWWIPFGLILWRAFRANQFTDAMLGPVEIDDAMQSVRTSDGKTLPELSAEQPLLVVFVRHAGCTFARQALADLEAVRDDIAEQGTAIAIVHQSDEQRVRQWATEYHLENAAFLSDPDLKLHRAFGLGIGSLPQLFGPRVWWRGFRAAILEGHGFGGLEGNGFQMPGAFLVEQGAITKAYRHTDASDRPDYCTLARSDSRAISAPVQVESAP